MLRPAAYLVALSHAAIAVAGAVVIAPGSAMSAELPARMAYVAEHRTMWLLAWMIPPVAGFLLLWMWTELRVRLDRDGRDARLQLAMIAVGVGLAVESVGAVIAAAALPSLGAGGEASTFVATERVVQLATATVGNAGFSLGQLLFTRALAAGGASRLVVGLGYATATAGGAFLIAGATGHGAATAVSNGALFVTLIAFSVMLARSPLADRP